MRSIGVWVLGISLISTPLFCQCDLAPLSNALPVDTGQKILFEDYVLTHFKAPGSPPQEQRTKHYRMRIGVRDGKLIITLIEQIVRSSVVDVPQGVLTIKPSPLGGAVKLHFSDFHAGLWNLRSTPTWTEADQTAFQMPTLKAWERLERMDLHRKAPAGFPIILTMGQEKAVESWLEVPQNLPYKVRMGTYHYSGHLIVSVFQPGNDLELATVKISSNWRGPEVLDEFERALRARGVSKDHIEELMQIISAAVKISR